MRTSTQFSISKFFVLSNDGHVSHSGPGCTISVFIARLSVKAMQLMPKILLHFFLLHFSSQRREFKKNSLLTSDLKQITYTFLSELQAGMVLPSASLLRSECSPERQSVDIQFYVSKY